MVCLQVGDLPPSVIPVHIAVVGCPISSMRTNYTTDQFQKEPTIRCPAPSLILCPLETLWLSCCSSTDPRLLGATQQESHRTGLPWRGEASGDMAATCTSQRALGGQKEQVVSMAQSQCQTWGPSHQSRWDLSVGQCDCRVGGRVLPGQ